MKMFGSELCKYAYTKTVMVQVQEENMVRSCTLYAYTKTPLASLNYFPAVRSCANTHKPKRQAFTCASETRFGAVQHAYTKTVRNFWKRHCRFGAAQNTCTKMTIELQNECNGNSSELYSTHIPKRRYVYFIF